MTSHDPSPENAESPEAKGPLVAADWAARYEARDTPWDKGSAHPELERRLQAGELEPFGQGRALVAGCGRAHDAAALARAGWKVSAVDVVDAISKENREAIEGAGGAVHLTDALAFDDFEEPFDLVFEHTFLCALHPTERGAWAKLIQRSLATGGCLAHVVFPADKPSADGGPPHGTSPDAVRELLGPDFQEEVLEPAQLRARDTWEEVWGVFRKQ